MRPPSPAPTACQVPRADGYLSVLHITPLRASRPLALRYLAQRLGLPLDRWVLVAQAAEVAGSAAGGDLRAGAFCSDAQDLYGGMQPVRVWAWGGCGRCRAVLSPRWAWHRCGVTATTAPLQVVVAVPEEDAEPPPSAGALASSLGVALQPFLEGTDRVVVAPMAQTATTVVGLLQQHEQAGEAK